MNNAIGLNLQTASSLETSQVIPIDGIPKVEICDNGECAIQDGSEFLAILNEELNALSDTELVTVIDPQVLENIAEVEELSDLTIPNSLLTKLVGQEGISAETVSIVESISPEVEIVNFEIIETEFKQALAELPEELVALPLTPENKMLIEQQAITLVKQKNPELVAQLDGQELPLKGKLLPLVEEVLVKQEAIKPVILSPASASTVTSAVTHNNFDKEIRADTKSKGISAALLIDSDVEPELEKSFKNMLEQSDKNAGAIKDKTFIENSVAKNVVQAEVISQKFATEAISTPFNSLMGANQASINTPTVSAVQSGSTLLLPQNPSPEQWGSALGDKVQYMINTKMKSAELRIDPPHLGKIDISIKMTDDGANVVIQTQHAATRELIDAASYRLKEMLEQSGHDRVDVDVSHKESHQSDNQFAESDEHNDSLNTSNSDDIDYQDMSNPDVIAGTLNNGRPGLDLFA